MSQYYSEIPGKYPSKMPPLTAGEICGSGWKIIPIGSEYILSFISGKLVGREKSVAITEDDYLRLASGAVPIDAILCNYDVG